MSIAPRIEKLQRSHEVGRFDCGRETLNRFLIRYAWQNQQAGASQTYVALMGMEVLGYTTPWSSAKSNRARRRRSTSALA